MALETRTSPKSENPLSPRPIRFLRSPLFPIFMIVFVDFLGLGITIPVLPLFAQKEFGASAFQVTWIFSTYFLAQFIASPQWGRASDRIGRRLVLLSSQLGTFAAFLISGVAPSLPFLFLARGIDGLTGGNISVAQAYLSDITDERSRARGLGIVNAAAGFGLMFGPAFGSLLAAHFGPRLPYFVAAVISLITISLTYFMLPESLTKERRAKIKLRIGTNQTNSTNILRLRGVPTLMALACAGPLSFFAFQSIFVLWSEKTLFTGHDTTFVQQAVGWILTYVGLTGILTQAFLVKFIAHRFGERWMVTGGLVVRSMAFIVMAFLPIFALLFLTVPMISFGTGLFVPGLIALLTYQVPPDKRGHAIGLSESAQGLGRIAGPLIAGFLFEIFGPNASIGFAGLVGLLSGLASLALWRAPMSSPVPLSERKST